MNPQSIKSILSILIISHMNVASHAINLRRVMVSTDFRDTDEFTRYVQNVKKVDGSTETIADERKTGGKSKSISTSGHGKDADFEDTNGSGSMDTNSADAEECFGNGAYVLSSRCETACCSHSCIERWGIVGQC
jgi:hypothetical protein